jgi:hypothetical protein
MRMISAILLMALTWTTLHAETQTSYFPSLLYGHVLEGSSPSRYETILVVRSNSSARVQIEIFDEKGEPMEASFVDLEGDTANAGTSFAFTIEPDGAVRVKLELPPQEASTGIAVKSGWVIVRGSEPLEVTALVRITTRDGALLTRHILASQTPTQS